MGNEGITAEPAISENKTYSADPLTLIVYLRAADGRAISYHRLYSAGSKRMMRILKCVDDFYHRNQLGGHNTKKLSVAHLSKLLSLPIQTVRTTVIQMASALVIWDKRADGKWKIASSHPLLVIQQKAKHISRNLWGKRTPLYVFPYSQFADELKKPQNPTKT